MEVNIGRKGVVSRVEDDGRGFDPDEVRTADSGGLRATKERAALMGGHARFILLPGERHDGQSVHTVGGCVTKQGGHIRVLPADGHTMFRRWLKETLAARS